MTRSSNHQFTGFRRRLAIFAAIICLGLAAIGVLLPGLPTTPFVLLASYLLCRSSTALHQRLLQNRVFGPLVKDWERRRAVSLRVKLWAMTVVFCCLVFTLAIAPLPSFARIIVAVMGGIGLVVIGRLPVYQSPSSRPASSRMYPEFAQGTTDRHSPNH